MEMDKITTSDYSIFIGEDLNILSSAIPFSKYSKVLLLVDENTERDCLEPLLPFIDHENVVKIKITSGEQFKNIHTCQSIWDQMISLGIDRSSLMINLGGGVIGDMGGFCAGTYMRGIDFIQIPTTLLSMVDASIGGKLGIDFKHLKNIIGLFQNPLGVYIHPPFLETLSNKELRSGFAEMLKHGLIADQNLWQNLTEMSEVKPNNVQQWIAAAITIKKEIVEQDPTEQNIRKYLNFGHTLGHALESARLGHETHLLHGEAIAHGMIIESFISFKKLGLAKHQLDEIIHCISNHYESIEITDQDCLSMLELVKSDKKNKEGKVLMVGLKSIGNPTYDLEINAADIEEAIEFYNNK